MRAAMDTLLLRLTAVEAMVMQKPIITGRYTGSPWLNLAQPLSGLINQQMEDLVALGKAVRRLQDLSPGLIPCLNLDSKRRSLTSPAV